MNTAKRSALQTLPSHVVQARYTLATKSTVAKTGKKPATKSTLSPVCRKSTVAGSFDFVDPVAVDIVTNVEHVQLGQLCEK